MGIGPKISSGDDCCPKAPNPNPFEFEVVSATGNNRYCLLQVKYHGCTSYEGVKIMLFKHGYNETRNRTKLDPHFVESGFGPFARFEPTQEGWKMGVRMLQTLIGE